MYVMHQSALWTWVPCCYDCNSVYSRDLVSTIFAYFSASVLLVNLGNATQIWHGTNAVTLLQRRSKQQYFSHLEHIHVCPADNIQCLSKSLSMFIFHALTMILVRILLYPRFNEVERGYTGFTLSVCPSKIFKLFWQILWICKFDIVFT